MASAKILGYAVINTKSNYRNLNGTTQAVIEYIPNKRVSCLIWMADCGGFVTADFSPNECMFL
jgi:hypothetical protein